jgi:acyl carrier protein
MTNKETVEYARKLALCDEVLNRNIRWWHRRQGSMPLGDRGKPFIEWLDWTIEYLSDQIDRWYDVPKELPPAEDIVCALRVNAEGDFLALYQEKKAKSCCMTDVNCYVEEGVVYSNIWLRSDYADLTYDEAREIAEQFRKVGYSAEVIVEDEDNREATVCAQIDFPLYRDMARSGRKADAVFMYSYKSDTIELMPKKEKRVSDRVKDAIAEAMMIDREKVTDESSFIDDLVADELDIIEIIMQLEEDFGFAIPEIDAEKIGTVRQAVEYIEGRLAENDDGEEKAKA